MAAKPDETSNSSTMLQKQNLSLYNTITYIQCNLLFSVIFQQICFPASIVLTNIKVIHRHQMMSVPVQPKHANYKILQ